MMKTAQAASRQTAHSAEASTATPLRHARTGLHTEGNLAGLQSAHGNQRLQRMLKHGVLQAKLTVNQPGDAFEQEADRVADAVMRRADFSAPVTAVSRISSRESMQRACSCGGTCEDCKQKADLQRSATTESPNSSAPPIVDEVLRSSGQSLDRPTRTFMEQRFGRDFSQIRVHSDARAAESAKAVNSFAYTVGTNLVFGRGQYAPASLSGQKLIAHELTHVAQQGHAPAMASDASSSARSPVVQKSLMRSSPMLQRVRCEAGVAPGMSCSDAQGSGHPAGVNLEHFDQDRHTLKATHLSAITAFHTGWVTRGSSETVEVHGYASCDGEANHNVQLSCDRAETVKAALVGRGITTSITTFAHGETDEFGPTLDDNRRVIIKTTAPPATMRHFEVKAVSMLACAPCNPFTDDGPAALSPPSSESAISSFRMKHGISADISVEASGRISSSFAGGSNVVGISHYCGTAYPARILAHSLTGPRSVTGIHGEGREWESSMESRVRAIVPCTLPAKPGMAHGAPCGDISGNPMIPPIMSHFRMRLWADGTGESEFVSATTYPFHYLFENGSLKTFGGTPVRPRVDFPAWATSTGVSISDGEAGFSALRKACCNHGVYPACDCSCSGGYTDLRPLTIVDRMAGLNEAQQLLFCYGGGLGTLVGPCPTACAPAGAACPGGPPTLPPNP